MNQGAAVVVGGSGGLGQAVCARLAEDWPAVVVGYRSNVTAAEAVAASLPAPCQGLALRCDLTETAGIEAALAEAVARFGRIGTIVLASGVAIAQPFVSQIGETDWARVIEVELMGFTRLVAAALPVFRRQQGGNFVVVSSVAMTRYPPGDALSAVPKAAIEMLCRAVAREEGRSGIRANAVAPGIIDSGLGAEFLKTLYTPEIWEQQRRGIALRRFGSGAEVAEAVGFLASERARYITGQSLVVDGGFSL